MALELNCTFAPLNPKVAFHAPEAKHLLEMLYPSVVLVQGPAVAAKLEEYDPKTMGKVAVKLFSPLEQEEINSTPTGWQDYSSFVENANTMPDTVSNLNVERKGDDVVVVLTTIGTTNLPKGCPHTNRSYSLMIRSTIPQVGLDQDENRLALCHSAVSHLMGANYSMTFHAAGLKVVHPAAAFDAVSSIESIRLERCSDIPAMPAIIQAMIAHPSLKGVDRSCVKHVHLGATTILSEMIRIAIEDFGALKASEAYGVTEVGPCIMHNWRELSMRMLERVTCGYVVPESKVRICTPDSNGKVLERGQPSEVHCSGFPIIKEYWLGATRRSMDAFYTDAEGVWIRAGDQG